MEPPFKPFGHAATDEAANFDKEFTEASTRLTPSDPFAIANLDQNAFTGFSFVNTTWDPCAFALLASRVATLHSASHKCQVPCSTRTPSPCPHPPLSNAAGVNASAASGVKVASTRRNVNEEHTWYRPDLPREEAMKRLLGKEAGTFYVRESSTQPGYAVHDIRLDASWLTMGIRVHSVPAHTPHITTTLGPQCPFNCYFPALIPSLRGPPPVSPQYVFLRRCYAIAMLTEGSKVWNGLVTPSNTTEGTTLYKLFVKQKFNSLPELIDFYCEHPVTTDSKGNKLKLKKPVA